jgi:hypothetical protein
MSTLTELSRDAHVQDPERYSLVSLATPDIRDKDHLSGHGFQNNSSTFEELPVEISTLVASFFSPSELCTLARVSRSLSSVVIPILYKSMSFSGHSSWGKFCYNTHLHRCRLWRVQTLNLSIEAFRAAAITGTTAEEASPQFIKFKKAVNDRFQYFSNLKNLSLSWVPSRFDEPYAGHNISKIAVPPNLGLTLTTCKSLTLMKYPIKIPRKFIRSLLAAQLQCLKFSGWLKPDHNP